MAVAAIHVTGEKKNTENNYSMWLHTHISRILQPLE